MPPSLRDLVPGYSPNTGMADLIPGYAPAPAALTLRSPETQAMEDDAAVREGNALTNSFVGARLTNEANDLGGQESSLRAKGDPASLMGAAGLRARIADLQARSQKFAAPVGRYEDVHGLGDAASFAAGQLGQGLGSSVDQIATGGAMGLGATALGFVPHPLAKAASLGLRALAPVEMYRQNANLLKGEAYNEVVQDPAAMQRPAQDIDSEVSSHGYRAAVMDTLPQLLPVGQIAGGFGKALSKVPAWGKFAGVALGEGATETGQQISQHYAHEALNPDRDTSEDRSENTNSLIGGAIGGGGMGAIGHVAEAGWRRLGTKGDGANGDALPLGGERAPTVAPGVAAPTPKDLAAHLAAPSTKDADFVARNNLLKGIPPDDVPVEDTEQWMLDTLPARMSATTEELGKLKKDPKAQQMAASLAALTPEMFGGESLVDALDILDAAGMYAAEKGGAQQASVDASDRIAKAAAAATRGKRKNNWQVESGPNKDLKGESNETRFGGPAKTSGAVNVNPAIGPELPTGRSERGGFSVKATSPKTPGMVETAAIEQARKDLTKKLLIMKGQDNDHKNFDDLAGNLADEFAAMAAHGKGNKPTPGGLTRAARVGQTMRDLLGNSAPWVVGHIAKTFKAEGSPTMQAVMDRVNAEVGPMSNGMDRETAAQGLVDIIPPEVQSRLLEKKIDLTSPDAREHLLRNIEDFADGTSDFALMPARKLFGKDVFDAMLEHVGKPIRRREGKAAEVGSQEEDSGLDETPLSSDDVGGDMAQMTDGMRSDEEKSQFEIDGEEKSLSAIPPEAMVFHHGDKGDTHRTMAEAWSESRGGELPQLLRLDTSTAKREGESDAKHAARTAPGAAEKVLARRIQALRERAMRAQGMSDEQIADRDEHDPRKSSMRDRYTIASTTAKDLMDRQNMQPSKRAELFFKYLEKEKHLTPEQAEFVRDRHDEVQDLDYMDRELTRAIGTSGLEAGRTSINQRLAARMPRIDTKRLKKITGDEDKIDAIVAKGRASGSSYDEETGAYVGKGTAQMMRELSTVVREAKAAFADDVIDGSLAKVPSIKAHIDKVQAERGTSPELHEIVNNFFAERHTVTAEQDSNRDHLQMNLTEFRAMTKKGAANHKSAWLSVRAMGWEPGSEAEQGEIARVQAGMNLIHFESAHAPGGAGVVSVPAYMLVDWVRSMRNAHETDVKEGGGDIRGKSQNMTRQTEDYKRDLLEGVSAMMQGGLTDGLPWIVNAKGDREDFKQAQVKGRPVVRLADGSQAPSTSGPNLPVFGATRHGQGRRGVYAPKAELAFSEEGEPLGYAETALGSLPPSLDLNGITDQKAMSNRASSSGSRADEEQRHTDSQSSLNEQRGISLAQALKDKELSAESNDVQDADAVADAVANAEAEANGSRTRDAQREDVKINSAIIASAADAAPRSMSRGRALGSAARVAESLWRDFVDTKGAAHARAMGRMLAYMDSAYRPSFNPPGESGMRPYLAEGSEKLNPARHRSVADSRLLMTGGEHYVFPLAALLTPRHLAEVAVRYPNDLHALTQLRSQVAAKLHDMAHPSEGYPRIKAGELGKMTDFLSGYTDRVAQAKLDQFVPEDENQRKEWEADKRGRIQWEGGERIVAKKRSGFLVEIVNDFVPTEAPQAPATKPFTDRSGMLPAYSRRAVGGLSAERVAEATKRLAAGVNAEASIAQMEQQLAQAEAEVKALREHDMSAGPSRTGGEKLSEMSALADKTNKLKARLIERKLPALDTPTENARRAAEKATKANRKTGAFVDKPDVAGKSQEVVTGPETGRLQFNPSRTITDTGEVLTFQPKDPNRQIRRKPKNTDVKPEPYEALGVPRTTGLAPHLSAEAVEVRTAESLARNNAATKTVGKLVDAARATPLAPAKETIDEARKPGIAKKVGEIDAAIAGKPVVAKPKPLNIWHGSGENASLSNLAARPFTFNKREYVSVEHAYQTNKSGKFDQATYDKYKSAGRKIPGTLGTKSEGGWNLKLMKRLVEESFGQNPKAAAELKATGNAELTHTQDTGIWAAEFPRILTEVRSELGTAPAAAPAKSTSKTPALDTLPSYTPGQKTMTYAGIGSRRTPPEVMAKMKAAAKQLETMGYMLNSGGAQGADTAFESGVAKLKNIFRGSDATDRTRAVVREVHPKPSALTPFMVNLMARNTNQVFGVDLNTPVDFVLAWTPDGAENTAQRSINTGGTGQAIDMASRKGIPVINMAKEGWQQRVRDIVRAKDTVKNNDQVVNSTAQTTAPKAEVNNPTTMAAPLDADIFKARAYIGKVLGPKVTALFEKSFPGMTGAADWSNAKQMVRIATGSPVSVMQRAYHESMHGFFSNILKNHPETRELLQRAMSTPEVTRRLEYLLKDWPKAVESMKADPEEAVAYAYQFWAAGMLTVGSKPANFFEKVQHFMRRVLGMVRETDKTLAIFEAFHDGKLVEPSAAGLAIAKVMATGEWQAKFKQRFDKQVQAAYSEVMTAHDVLRTSESATLRGLSTQWWANPGDPESAGKTGVIDRRGIKTNQYESRLHAVLDTLSGENQERDLKALVDRMNGGKAEASPEVEAAAGKLHALLDHYYKYAKEAGLKMGERDMGKYWPVIWDLEKMVEQKNDFIAMLTAKYPMQLRSALATIQKVNPNVTTVEEVAQAMHQAIVDRGGVDEGALDAHREDGILTPYFASQNTRTFDWIKAVDRQPFLSTDIVSTSTRYLHQGVRAAEYVRAFGEGGQNLRDTMARAGDVQMMTADGPVTYKKDGPVVSELKSAANDLKLQGQAADEWIARRMEDAQRAMGAMEGVLGKDISAGMRKFQSAAMVYQGLRVLTLSLFSAMLDPNGIKVAGGTTQNMLDAYVHGLKNVVGTWKDILTGSKLHTRGDDQDLANAASVGAISPTMFLEGMGAAHTSEYTAGPARRINRGLFLANGLTAWDRSMRIMAVKAAMQSIASNEKNASPEHSARWLRELGLKQGDVTLDADGHLVIDRHSIAAYKGLSAEDAAAEALKVHTAVNRWVNRAIVSPNAAQRPARASDPHYAMFYQLKQFTYSFQKTTMTYALNEAKAGNMAAGGQLLMGLPIMIAADVSKAVITGGGSLPGYMANWTMADWLAHSWNRAGLSGIGQFGIDALHDPLGTLGGPTISQAVNAATHPVGETLLSAVPVLNKLGGLAQAVKDIE